jgi:hypothetical protein
MKIGTTENTEGTEEKSYEDDSTGQLPPGNSGQTFSVPSVFSVVQLSESE